MALVAGFLAVTLVMVNLKARLLRAEAHQRQIANHDPLTGVANRRAFDAALRRELERRTAPHARRDGDGDPLALMIVDLDDFKTINDDHGHPAGDAVLRQTAERARSVLRSTDLLARIGGDEFAVIAPGAHGENAERLAEAIRTAVAISDPRSAVPSPAVSVGLATFPEDGEDFETLMKAADQRLLRRKESNGSLFSGRGRGTLRLI
jgi:diguanylate cyclase (GGDEF)-like protein